MNSTQKLSCAIAAILGGSASGISYATPAADTASATTDTGGLQEIVVTAQRRNENLQDVPITIQAFSGDTLAKLNVQTFDDFIKYLPNVTMPTNGPGQGNIFMRGLSAGGFAGTQSSGSIGGFPNVAIYLDDQSGQLPGRNLDIYAADLERIEILEGPQGTLFGAGAQAGVVRYITNKPKLDVTEGSVTAGYGTTAGGANNSNLEAVLNLPLISDTLAVRAVIYNDTRGGYIDNVPSTFTRQPTDLGIHYGGYATGCTVGTPTGGACPSGSKANAYGVPPGSAVLNNYNIAQNDINPVTYQGMRVSALWKINEDWNVLLAQTYQEMNDQGVFYQMPYSSDGTALQPQQVSLFSPSYDKDKFENTAWTVNGKVGDLKLVYTGAYLVRNVDQVQDYTNYARGVYADYYQCHGAGGGQAATCYSPQSSWREQERNTHQSHEFRLSTPDDWRARGILGAFWEDQEIQDQTDWSYKTLPACSAAANVGCLTDIGPVPGSTTTNPSLRNDNTAFFEDVQRGYKQYAFFGSFDYDLIPKTLTFTAGTRYYHFSNFENGTVVSSFGCYQAGPAPCTSNAPYSVNLNGENLRSTYSGFKSRANLSWHITSDAMLYYTWSQGFRPGGFNREGIAGIPGVDGVKQFVTPLQYGSDSLTNNELGWKTEFFNHRLQWDGAIYQENWDNVQFGFFDPGQTGNLAFGTNGPNYRIRGLETSLTAQLMQGLTATGAASWNSSVQTNSPYLIANNPALLTNANPAVAAEYGKPSTAIPEPYGPLGSPTANSPPIQLNLRLRYEWMVDDYHAFVQGGGTHVGHSFTQAGSNPTLSTGGAVNTTLLRFEDPAYSTFDASVGFAKDAWNVQAYGQNLGDSHAAVFTSTGQFIEAQTILRPRVLGVSFGYKF